MVDFVSEVSQWMVGIKRLIMEARSILPQVPTPPPGTTGLEAGSSGEATAKDELNPGQSVDDLVPQCSLLKVNDGECRPGDEETVESEGGDKQIPDEEELDKAKSAVSQPSVSKMSNEKETDESASEIDSRQDSAKNS